MNCFLFVVSLKRKFSFNWNLIFNLFSVPCKGYHFKTTNQ